MKKRAVENQGRRWPRILLASMMVLGLGVGVGRAAADVGGAHGISQGVAFSGRPEGAHSGGGHAGAEHFGNGHMGNGHFGGRPFHHFDHGRGIVVLPYPYYLYDPYYAPYDPWYPYDAYCDPNSPEYDPQYC
jgi:hypothetical protein